MKSEGFFFCTCCQNCGALNLSGHEEQTHFFECKAKIEGSCFIVTILRKTFYSCTFRLYFKMILNNVAMMYDCLEWDGWYHSGPRWLVSYFLFPSNRIFVLLLCGGQTICIYLLKSFLMHTIFKHSVTVSPVYNIPFGASFSELFEKFDTYAIFVIIDICDVLFASLVCHFGQKHLINKIKSTFIST